VENDQTENPAPEPTVIEPIEIPRPVPNANQALQKGIDPDKIEHR
jgi:hypothetical protein